MRSLLILTAAVIMVSCSGSGGQADDSPPEASPPPPPTSYDSSTDTDVAGRDADNNGIRDDIDEYIVGEFPQSFQRLAQQSAKLLQEKIVEGEQSSRELLKEFGLNAVCWIRFDRRSDHERLIDATLNTDIRMQAYFDSQRVPYVGHNAFDFEAIDQYCQSFQ